MRTNNKSGRFKTKKSLKRVRNADHLANYELMLRIYLINKEQALTRQTLASCNTGNKAADSNNYSSASNNISAVIYKANQLINTFRRPKIAIAVR